MILDDSPFVAVYLLSLIEGLVADNALARTVLNSFLALSYERYRLFIKRLFIVHYASNGLLTCRAVCLFESVQKSVLSQA